VKSKYRIRVMRPSYERAILAVDAESESAAVRYALDAAARLTDDEWRLLAVEREPPLIEITLSEQDSEEPDAAIVAFLRDVQHAYALLQANLAEGRGDVIVPSWLRRQPDLAVADIMQDWNDALSAVHEEGVEKFIDWLARQSRPTNVGNFLAECAKRRRKPRSRSDDG
jgi:hypothetical protein